MGQTTRFLFLSFSLFVSFDRCLGQPSTFQWKFGNNLVSTALQECGNYSLVVEPLSTPPNSTALGTPPYYLIAFAPGGIPTTSFVGTDPTNLTWRVNQPAGTNLLLTVTDSLGLSGGQPPSLFSVISGASRGCIPPPPTTNITLVANITGPLKTCQPLGLRVYGGQMPYNISLAAPNSPVVTNVTLGPHDDVFTYIDRADPNSQLLVAVSDATGQWGTGTSLFPTVGSTVVDCVGLISTSGNSSSVNQHPRPPSKNNTAVIVGVVVPVVVVALLLLLAFRIWRRKKLAKERESEPAFIPDAWAAPAMSTAPGLQAEPYASRPSSKHSRSFAPDSRMASTSQFAMAQLPSHGRTLSSTSVPDERDTAPASTASLPPSSASVPAKGRRPRLGQHNLSESSSHPSGSTSQIPPGLPASWQVEPNIIIQHEDGGVVQELPPPYLDRSTRNRP